MKILHLGQVIGGLDIYIRNSIIYAEGDYEYILVHGDKDNKTRSHTDGFQRNNAKCLDEKGISRFVPHSSI